MSFAGGRSPFRPLQQPQDPNLLRMSQQSFRSRDSPMDFSYDSPARQQSSAWLNESNVQHGEQENRIRGHVSGNHNKRDRDDAQMNQPFVFGDREGSEQHSQSNGSHHLGGKFLFQQSTIPGPEVDMETETPPKRIESNRRKKNGGGEEGADRDENQAGTSKRPVSQSAVLRVNRQRAANSKKSSSSSRRRKISLTQGLQGQQDEDDDDDDNVEWEDDEKHLPSTMRNRKGVGKERNRSLSKRVGDTLNIHYFFNQRHERDSLSPYNNPNVNQNGTMTSKKWLDPEWCLGMAQFGFNATLLVGMIWILFNVVRTLQKDVSSKVREYEMEYLAEIEACSQSFHLNKCGTDGAVPALANACASWQRCSARDPGNVGKARVAAETVAEIVNGFVDVVSWKSMLFTLLSLIILVGATNSFLSFFRIRSKSNRMQNNDGSKSHQQAAHQHPIPPHYGMPAYDHPQSRAWYPSPPVTPQSKRMCR